MKCSRLTAISVRPSAKNTFKDKTRCSHFPLVWRCLSYCLDCKHVFFRQHSLFRWVPKCCQGWWHTAFVSPGITGQQLIVKAWKSSSTFHYCLGRSLIRKCRNLYWVETSMQQVMLQDVKYPFGWRTNAVTAWDLSLQNLYRLCLLIQQIQRSADLFEVASSTLNIVLSCLLCCAFITALSINSNGKQTFIIHYPRPTVQRACYPGQTSFSSPDLNLWLAMQWIIWYGVLVTAWPWRGTSKGETEVVKKEEKDSKWRNAQRRRKIKTL